MSIQYIIGHRGASGYEPENTLLSFEKAVELGANAVEGDFRVTRDGQIVCIHDETVDRTTNGKGRVEEMTSQELRKLDAGSGQKIPTLEEFIDFVMKKKITGFIDVKSEGIELAVVDMIRSKKAIKSTLVVSFFAESLKNIVKTAPEIRLGLIFDFAVENIVEKAVEISVGAILPEMGLVNKELIDKAHQNRIVVVPWAIDLAADAKKMEALGVDGMATNKPNIIAAAVKIFIPTPEATKKETPVTKPAAAKPGEVPPYIVLLPKK